MNPEPLISAAELTVLALILAMTLAALTLVVVIGAAIRWVTATMTCPHQDDHGMCDAPDCRQPLCPWPCDGHEQPTCVHTTLDLCPDHGTGCAVCNAEARMWGVTW